MVLKRIASWWEQLNGRDLGRAGGGRLSGIETDSEFLPSVCAARIYPQFLPSVCAALTNHQFLLSVQLSPIPSFYRLSVQLSPIPSFYRLSVQLSPIPSFYLLSVQLPPIPSPITTNLFLYKSLCISITDIQPKINIDEISLRWLFCGC